MARTIHAMVAAVAVAGCSSKPRRAPSRDAAPVTAPAPADAAPSIDGAPLPPHREYATLAKAIVATLPADARVVGFGELHIRTDRPGGVPALARFRADILPEVAPIASDLVLETWIVDPKCGARAQDATARVESTMLRPESTKTDLAQTIEAARGAGVHVHAMRLGCDDYDRVAPKDKPVDVEVLLDLVTRELGRITASAIAHRTKEGNPRPLIAVYGGALHNDRFPIASVAQWSYAAAVDKASADRYVEIDLIAPELAAQDALSQQAEWFPLVAAASRDRVRVFERGPRSFVIILPTS